MFRAFPESWRPSSVITVWIAGREMQALLSNRFAESYLHIRHAGLVELLPDWGLFAGGFAIRVRAPLVRTGHRTIRQDFWMGRQLDLDVVLGLDVPSD